uniref:Uncharacterized protein n=1 Tax=Rhizophora mucronata TaxID=61149 RepID=A0A2P2QB85_RHIMU
MGRKTDYHEHISPRKSKALYMV